MWWTPPSATRVGTPVDRARWPVVYLSPRGAPFTQATARRFAAAEGITLLCGRFEGVDQRVLDHHQVEEVSLGDFVLTGGEIAAQAMLDATVRLIPGVLGNAASTEEESFSDGLLEHPQYTRPASLGGAGDSRRPAIRQPRRDRQVAPRPVRRADPHPPPGSVGETGPLNRPAS
jgi:tRNA (guanine-N1)-methyltransferase